MLNLSKSKCCKSWGAWAALLLVSSAPTLSFAQKVKQEELPVEISFNQHIRPIMSNTCFTCHGPDDNANDSGIRLDSFEAAVNLAGVIEPRDGKNSLVVERIKGDDDPMPPKSFRHQLSKYEKDLFEKWIDQGAKYETHWAYSPLKTPDVPETKKKSTHPIDAFVQERLKQNGIEPTESADKRTLLRRLSLDLTGLPPNPEEIDAFLADSADDAYEKQVDRLLASPHYGERMASRWLDIVRFSDTVGFHGDQNQHIFPFRDYVISSINSNQPFDEFTREQLAGDLFENPSESELIATGLLRLNMMTREGGAQPDEYLAKYSADRVRMIGTAWLGSTLGCCECHDHKYDPFSAKDFYSLGAFFDDMRQWGVYTNYPYTPNPDLSGYTNDYPFPPEIRVASPSLKEQIKFLERQLDKTAAALVANKDVKSKEYKEWFENLVSEFKKTPTLWTPVSPERIILSHDEDFQVADDDSILFSGPPRPGQKINVVANFDQPAWIKSVQLQVLPDQKNGGKVGRSKTGKFEVVFSVTHNRDVSETARIVTVRPRYVRIELAGQNQILSLAEVQVFDRASSKLNLALAGTVSQSSTDFKGPPELANDGNTGGNHNRDLSTSHTSRENIPWWELDLGEQADIGEIVIWNRTDGHGDRLKGYRLSLLDENREIVFTVKPGFPNPSTSLSIPETVQAADLMAPLKIAFSQADRYIASRYSNGKANHYLESTWKSGPARWQIPDESELQHNAIYHLDRPVKVDVNDELVFRIESSDVGRVRLLTSSNSRATVDSMAGSEDLLTSLSRISKSEEADQPDEKNAELQSAAIKSAWFRFKTAEIQLNAQLMRLRDEIAGCYSGYALSLVSQPLHETKIRQSRVLERGDWKDKSGELVVPNTPHFLPGYQEQTSQRLNRLDLANWIVAKENPLTARHYVNRIWKHFFGNGFSNVLDDLGNQGEWPSHPDLFDWLASDFQNDWDRKKLARLIVTSQTYRQKAAVRKELLERDPHNRLLAQQSARRLEAEIIRDNALAVSGLIQKEWIGGRSVFPFQPPGYYANIQFPNRKYVPQTNGLQYRRGIYMHWQRTFLHPMLANFDAPSRDECTASRILSNSPQQALTLLNDPVFVEASISFADRIIGSTHSQEIETWIDMAFELALARKAGTQEIKSLSKLYNDQLRYYLSNNDAAQAYTLAGQYRPHSKITAEELAAFGQVCRVVLNLHEFITRF